MKNYEKIGSVLVFMFFAFIALVGAGRFILGMPGAGFTTVLVGIIGAAVAGAYLFIRSSYQPEEQDVDEVFK